MEKIVIAKILKPQGIKGELKCKPMSDMKIFSNLKEVFISEKSFTVLSSVYRFGYVYITLKGLNNRNDAENYRNLLICVDKSIFSNDILISDYIDSTIYDEDSNELGIIKNVEQYGSADIFNIKLKNGGSCSVANVNGLVVEFKKNDKKLIINKNIFLSQKIED